MQAYIIIAFANPSQKGLRKGIAIAETEDAALEMSNDPTAVAFPIALSQHSFQTPRFEWTRDPA